MSFGISLRDYVELGDARKPGTLRNHVRLHLCQQIVFIVKRCQVRLMVTESLLPNEKRVIPQTCNPTEAADKYYCYE